jgi:DNA phosphorothioation-dependent restriction protein DptH
MAVTAPYHVLLGSLERQCPQWGHLGLSLDDRNRRVAVDLNTITAACLFGEPGAGKSYCMGSFLEMGLMPIPGVNVLPVPLASVVFHYSSSPAYKPEMAASLLPNDHAAQRALLKERYGADPAGVAEVLLLAPSDLVATRRAEFPGVTCARLAFHPSELTAMHWKILMGAVGEDDSLYFQVMNQILRRHREGVTIERIQADVAASELSRADQDRASVRLRLAADFIDPAAPLIGDYLKRGRLVIVDLRDEYIQKKEALALAIVLLQVFADTTDAGKPIQKIFTFDEAHKYLRDEFLVDILTETIREMRHKATSVLIASQDPPSIPQTIIELASLMVVLRMSAPQWVRHVQNVKLAYQETVPARVAELHPGEALVWCKYASDAGYMAKPYRIAIRPRASKHGGDTRSALPTAPAVAAPAAEAPSHAA